MSDTSSDDPAGPDIAASIGKGLADKAHLPWPRMIVLAMVAGAFIGFGGIGFLIARATAGDAASSSGATYILAGLVFSVGLILVMVAGAELFTGNTMMVLPVAQRRLSAARLAGAWSVVWVGNLVGGVLVAVLFVAAGGTAALEGGVGAVARDVTIDKVGKGPGELLASGILANMLVCLAVWMATGARTIPAKAMAIVGPVTIFVAAGFEHSVANMALLPIGWAAAPAGTVPLAAVALNLFVSTIGNIIGGSVVALGLAYGHDAAGRPPPRSAA